MWTFHQWWYTISYAVRSGRRQVWSLRGQKQFRSTDYVQSLNWAFHVCPKWILIYLPDVVSIDGYTITADVLYIRHTLRTSFEWLSQSKTSEVLCERCSTKVPHNHPRYGFVLPCVIYRERSWRIIRSTCALQTAINIDYIVCYVIDFVSTFKTKTDEEHWCVNVMSI